MSQTTIDADWCAGHPLPSPEGPVDKNGRGRLLVVGGCEFVPGAIRLTGEAAMRAGAGKLRLATVDSVARSVGALFPEAAMIGLPMGDEGEIAPSATEALERAASTSDAIVVGPGMHRGEAAAELTRRMLGMAGDDVPYLLDAGALEHLARVYAGEATLPVQLADRIVITPHHGEMAALTGLSEQAVAEDPDHVAADVAKRLKAVVVLKSRRTVVVGPDGACLAHESVSPGLATGGSGDVLAGVIAGLLARGVPPAEAAAWGVFVHGQAGRRAGDEIGKVGFLARDLLIFIPAILTQLG